MEPDTDLLGNPLTLLIERIFWLILGGFFGLALITSIIRTLKERDNKEKVVTPKDLETLANKAIIDKNDDMKG